MAKAKARAKAEDVTIAGGQASMRGRVQKRKEYEKERLQTCARCSAKEAKETLKEETVSKASDSRAGRRDTQRRNAKGKERAKDVNQTSKVKAREEHTVCTHSKLRRAPHGATTTTHGV